MRIGLVFEAPGTGGDGGRHHVPVRGGDSVLPVAAAWLTGQGCDRQGTQRRERMKEWPFPQSVSFQADLLLFPKPEIKKALRLENAGVWYVSLLPQLVHSYTFIGLLGAKNVEKIIKINKTHP